MQSWSQNCQYIFSSSEYPPGATLLYANVFQPPSLLTHFQIFFKPSLKLFPMCLILFPNWLRSSGTILIVIETWLDSSRLVQNTFKTYPEEFKALWGALRLSVLMLVSLRVLYDCGPVLMSRWVSSEPEKALNVFLSLKEPWARPGVLTISQSSLE